MAAMEQDMKRRDLIGMLSEASWFDLTQPLSLFTPPWPGEMPLQVHFFKRLTGSYHGGQGANGQLIERMEHKSDLLIDSLLPPVQPPKKQNRWRQRR